MGNRMPRAPLVPLLWLWAVAAAAAQDAPFGLAWGPVDSVPKPSMVDREANITALIYLRGRAPASGPDIDEVVLEICRDEGLQEVIWLSRPLTEAELRSRYDTIHREGVRRYGTPGTDTARVPSPGQRDAPSLRYASSRRESSAS